MLSCFSKVVHFYYHIHHMQEYQFFHILAVLGDVSLFTLVNFQNYQTAMSYNFNFSDSKHFQFLVFCLGYFIKYLFKSFATLKNEIVFLLGINQQESCFYSPDMSSLSHTCIVNIFSQSVTCLFIFLMVTFDCKFKIGHNSSEYTCN